MNKMEILARYWHDQLTEKRSGPETDWLNIKRDLHEQRGNQVVRMSGLGKKISEMQINHQEIEIEYVLRVSFLIKQKDYFYQEEEERFHRVTFHKGSLIKDVEQQPTNKREKRYTQSTSNIELTPVSESTRFDYDRRAAVRYAERWWNDTNSDYHYFQDNDCTNFISQCLAAGGAPMRGYPDRGTGWWYQDNKWSYSWSVAHTMRWYLSGSTKGLRGYELEDPTELLPGDIICYDFEGDGQWDHTTIVVAKDQDEMPLVNAHTNNSRHRYWDYQDSMAWTTDCQYKFFRIG